MEDLFLLLRECLIQFRLVLNSLCSQGWPSAPVPPVSASWGLILQTYATIPGLDLFWSSFKVITVIDSQCTLNSRHQLAKTLDGKWVSTKSHILIIGFWLKPPPDIQQQCLVGICGNLKGSSVLWLTLNAEFLVYKLIIMLVPYYWDGVSVQAEVQMLIRTLSR